jgi:hypothetical protein
MKRVFERRVETFCPMGINSKVDLAARVFGVRALNVSFEGGPFGQTGVWLEHGSKGIFRGVLQGLLRSPLYKELEIESMVGESCFLWSI